MDMEDREKELEELIRSMAENTGIPASIHPDAVEKKLEAAKAEKKRRLRRKYITGAVAACLCIAVGITGSYLHFFQGTSETSDMTAGSLDSAAGAPSDSGESAEDGAEESLIASAESYDEIYEYIQAEREQTESDAGIFSRFGITEESSSTADSAASGSASNSGSAASAGGSGTSYSDTNVREEGVGEADIVKTDGSSLYIVNGQTVEIVGIESAEMEELAEIRMADDCYIMELYVQDDRLVIMYTRTEYSVDDDGYYNNYRDYTNALVYDISDRMNPVKMENISQSGYYNTMRVRDSYVYVISNFYADTAAPRADTAAYIPKVQGSAMAVSDIYMPQRQMGDQYTVITSFSLENPSEKTDSKAVFGSSGMCYVSTENIYVTEGWYGQDDAEVTRTSIRKVSYKDGILHGEAQTKVDGTLNDSFSIDEYNGYLRLVTTVSPVSSGVTGIARFFSGDTEERNQEDSNSLYVLDENLEIAGEIHDLAKDESVYSARFMGDVGYFVTFKQVDPLFSVDLSDPSDPEIIGELKIPGFSEYLHPYGDGQMLGIGMDVDEESVTTDGVKISMFDISDPADVKEEETYVLEDLYGTDVGYNYKAVFVDVEKNLFGFMAYGDITKYFIFTYDENGFREVFSRELTLYGNVRGLYAGERFYLVNGNTVESFTMDGFQKVDDIVL